MRKKLVIATLSSGLVAATYLAAQARGDLDRWWKPELDAIMAAPENHRVLLENEDVRVLDVSIAPGAIEKLHVHRYPSVIYLESSPHLIEHLQDGSVRDLGVRPRGAWWLPVGQGHFLENVDTFPLHAIRIELKKAR